MKQKESYRMIKAINKLFEKRIEHQRIKKFGKYSTVRTAIREEPIKLAQYLRGAEPGVRSPNQDPEKMSSADCFKELAQLVGEIARGADEAKSKQD